jgi:hypothetical protein
MRVEADTRPAEPPCDGCNATRPETLTTLWAKTILGLTGVYVHEHRPCAEAARADLAIFTRGPVEFITPPPLRMPGMVKAESAGEES